MKIKYLDQTELSRLFDVIRKASVRDHALFSLAYRYGLQVNLSLASSNSRIPGKRILVDRCFRQKE